MIAESSPRNSLIIAFSIFYALAIIIATLLVELTQWINGGDRRHRRGISLGDLLFGVYMYGASIAFLLYCYVAHLRKSPKGKKRNLGEASMMLDVDLVQSRSLPQPSVLSEALPTLEEEMDDCNDSTEDGSLFLRFGCVVFGVIGTVFYAFSALLCASDDACDHSIILLNAMAITFVFIQMHFIFCHWRRLSRVIVTGAQSVALRFGTAHLVATNLWTWTRYILIEESAIQGEIRQLFVEVVDSSSATPSKFADCEGADCFLLSLSEVMYTSIVEYSLIGAGVMFIAWREIDTASEEGTTKARAGNSVRKRDQIQLDCSQTSKGLFLGFGLLAATLTSMALMSTYVMIGQSRKAVVIFGLTEISQYLIAAGAASLALWRMRLLHRHSSSASHSSATELRKLAIGRDDEDNLPIGNWSAPSPPPPSPNANHGPDPNQELLDIILLAVGMAGEITYSLSGLLGLSVYSEAVWHPISVLLLLVHISRIVEVGLQSWLIYTAGKLTIGNDSALRRAEPGKQAITFLVMANVSMFLMNLMDAQNAEISNSVVNFYGTKVWFLLVRSFSPLIIFYRFHSSVCLAEVWKSAYA